MTAKAKNDRTVLIAFLRGVNMTGHNSVKMADLASLFKKLGFEGVRTFIQSGNVLFTDPSRRSIDEISTLIEEAIYKKWKYNVPALVRTAGDLIALNDKNPFLAEPDFNDARMAVIFLTGEPDTGQLKKVEAVNYPPDKFKIEGSEIYIFCPNGFGKTKLYTNFFENKMKVTGTARNWKTICTLTAMAEEI